MIVKNIIFDLDNVLLRLDSSATAKKFQALGATDLGPLSQYSHSTPIVGFETGKISAREFRSTIRSSIGLPASVTDEQFDEAWNAALLDFPKGRLELMRTLKKDFGYNVYLLSNTNAIHVEYINKVCLKDSKQDSLDVFFDKVYHSHEIGHRKPSREAFEHVLKDQGINGSETLFLDDMPDYVDAAKTCGLQAAQVDVETDLGFLQLRF
ncbi:HAD-superfamily hydrolase, subfamily IA, variant 3 [Lobosporangium transversale]|uniref:HAD-superfamily hydrolase, subfamily IA, variant 3 n=1 Tax=Lobosporangium transversale TaxID=64571 RepID=A0A1Y2GDB3_9FUNG|nr:HAD-superfamily hydrolase, subfamily IA, variant 3 [Lobosporangium transversale]ORZ04667.1 HAD-superfamily hydrolase, subfamily IA, variant 3 [Lobosporangium transversale]|eukprot:XP_021876664.1 HAD-superfamily hydrolase, subfamily IA, variant 3 [Lobosporangium transversale]